MKLSDKLREMNACDKAIEWVEENDYNLQQAWRNCQRGDWMIWFASRMDVDHRKLTLARARQARLVYHLMNDERSKKAVDVAEAYGLGKATREELAAAAAAATAFAAAAAWYAWYAVYDAAYDADARRETLAKCADICRDILTDEILEQNKLNKKRNNGLRKDIR